MEAAFRAFSGGKLPEHPVFAHFIDLYQTCKIGSDGMSGLFQYPAPHWGEMDNRTMEALQAVDAVYHKYHASKQQSQTHTRRH